MTFPWCSHDIPTISLQKETSQEGGFLPPHVTLILAQGKAASEDTFVFFFEVSCVTCYFIAFLWVIGRAGSPLHFHINFTFQPSTLCQAIFLEALGDAQFLLR